MGALEDRVAIVTGGTGALGRVVVREFLKEGAKVLSPYIEEQELRENMSLLKENKDSLVFVNANVAKEKQVARLVKKTLSSFGALHILVNLVGGFFYSEILDTGLKELEAQMEINLKTAFLVSKACLPTMIEQNYGRVVNISSRPALRGAKGMGAYAASKAAVLNLTETLANEMMEYDINVNAVLPSTIDTPANRKAMPKANFSKWVPPKEVARVIVFLCSEDSRGVTGAGIPVFGRA